MPPSVYPTTEKLSVYLLGKLPDAWFQMIADHVDGWTSGTSALQGLEGVHGSLLPPLRGEVSGEASSPDTELHHLLARAKTLGLEEAPAAGAEGTLPDTGIAGHATLRRSAGLVRAGSTR